MPYMATLLNILSFIATFVAVLAVLVLVHEVGHFVTARMAGVQVLEFGFGYPPRLFAIKRGETEYSFNAVPLGGFVKLMGEEDPAHPRSLARQPAGVRAIILSSGALMNALLPVVIFSITAAIPQPAILGDVRVTAVAPGSPAERAGVRPGDVIEEVNGQRVSRDSELRYLIRLSLGSLVEFRVRREGQTQMMRDIMPRLNPPPGQGAIGIAIRTGDIQVETVAPGSPASRESGLRAGDLVIQVNGRAVSTDRDLATYLAEHRQDSPGRPVEFLVERDGLLQTVAVPLPAGESPLMSEALGVTLAPARLQETVVAKPVWEAVPYAVKRSLEMLVLVRNEISSWFAGIGTPQFAGPIGIAQITGEVASLGGLYALLELTALLSISMAFFNILPIPMLDGGRLLFVVLEVVRRGRRISPQREGMVHMVGFAVLLALIVVVSYFDVLRIVRGESLLR